MATLAAKVSVEDVVALWAKDALDTGNMPPLNEGHPVTYVRAQLPSLVEALEKAGYK